MNPFKLPFGTVNILINLPAAGALALPSPIADKSNHIVNRIPEEESNLMRKPLSVLNTEGQLPHSLKDILTVISAVQQTIPCSGMLQIPHQSGRAEDINQRFSSTGTDTR